MNKIIILALSAFVLFSNNAKAVEKESINIVRDNNEVQANDKWIELQSVIIPFDLNVKQTTNSNGNPKYWITFKNIGDVTISAINYKKYSEKTEKMELVKWGKNNKVKYTIRAKGKDNIDLTKLFEK